MSIIDTLVTDRTKSDVDRVQYLNGLWDIGGVWTGTADELDEWTSGLKGAYNATDLNRVGAAIDYVAVRLRSFGNSVEVSPKKDWTTEDTPTVSQMKQYQANVAALRAVLAVLPTTPAVPSTMDGLTYSAANDIEQILLDISRMLDNIAAGWYYSGDFMSGDV